MTIELSDVRLLAKSARLPASCEQVMILCWSYGLTPEQAADKLQVTVNAVKVRLSKARAQIRRVEHQAAGEERETVREHAEGIWEAMKRLQCSPPTPQYDEHGEIMPVHGRAVGLEDVIIVCRRREERVGVRG